MVNRSRFYTVGVSIVIALLCFEAQILFSFITTTRISLAVLLFLFAGLLLEKKPTRINKVHLPLLFFFVFILLWSILNSTVHIFSGSRIDIKPFISLCLIFLTIGLFSLIITNAKIQFKELIRLLWIFGNVMVFLTFFILYLQADFNFFDSSLRISKLKHFFNDNLPGGTSRYFYGLVTLNTISLGFALGYLKSGKRNQLISIAGIVLLLIMLFVANSRQNILFLLFIAIFPKLLTFNIIKVLKFSIRALIVVAISIAVLSYTTDILSNIKEKYIERTTSQIEEGSERIETYTLAYEDIRASPIMGTGLGNFERRHGITTHNGYLWVGAELGLLPLVVYSLILIWLLFTFTKSKSSFGEYKPFYTLIFAYLAGYILIANNFNELTKDYIFYVLLLLYWSPFIGNKKILQVNG